MKNKSDVFGIFKFFHVMVEREIRKPLKYLKSDNGVEYYSNEFVEYYNNHRIRHEKSIPYTQQHNRVAKKMNKTLNERVRSMFSSAKLSKSFWAKAFKYSLSLGE